MDHIMAILRKPRPNGFRIGGLVTGDIIAVEDFRQSGDIEGQDVELTRCGSPCWQNG